MKRPSAALLLALTVVAGNAAPARAQEDYRGLDAGRPIRASDAYPIKFLEWEFQLGARGALADGHRGAGAALSLEAGILRNTELALEIGPAFERAGGVSETGLEELALHLLHNVNQESWSWPALSLTAGLDAPIGGALGRNDWALTGGLIATRSFASATRLHVNAGYTLATRQDGGDVWHGALAFDHPLSLAGRLLVGDVFVEVPVDGSARVWTELGTRLQLTNRTVLDLGVATRADEWADGRGNIELNIGLSRTFGLGFLSRRPAWPDPTIR